jgi:hypothetical protein
MSALHGRQTRAGHAGYDRIITRQHHMRLRFDSGRTYLATAALSAAGLVLYLRTARPRKTHRESGYLLHSGWISAGLAACDTA